MKHSYSLPMLNPDFFVSAKKVAIYFLGRRIKERKRMKNGKVFPDGDMCLIKNKVVSVIGHGNQGQVQGRILRSNGADVDVGNIKMPVGIKRSRTVLLCTIVVKQLEGLI